MADIFELTDYLYSVYAIAFNSSYATNELFILLNDIVYYAIAIFILWFLIVLPLSLLGGVLRGRKQKQLK